jgi:hypothetical protein
VRKKLSSDAQKHGKNATIPISSLKKTNSQICKPARFKRTKDIIRRIAWQCQIFARQIHDSLMDYAVVRHPEHGKIYAYEFDGYGGRLLMDDANVPSLLSLTYMGIHKQGDDLYENTRKFLLGPSNPYYIKGKAAQGQGSPHTGKFRLHA